MADSGAVAAAAAASSVPEIMEHESVVDPVVEPAPQTAPDSNPSAKRKLDDLEPREDEETPLKKQEIKGSGGDAVEVAVEVKDGDEKSVVVDENVTVEKESVNVDGDKLKEDSVVNGAGVDGAEEAVKETPVEETDQLLSAQDGQTVSVPSIESSHRIEVPNAKVGVLIGKAGETIKLLQINSGAKIQITRDAEADPHSSTRHVELLGTPEQVSKAEKLIKDVIAEAEAGGSPSLVARGLGTVQSGGDQTEIKVPNEKVGVIIGKGGETIKNLQTRSGARIQLIPQHLPEGDTSKERVVRITGNKKQIETAKEMIKDTMSQTHARLSSVSGGYNQHGFRPRGSAPMPHWGARPTGPAQPSMGYDHQQRGMYPPPQTTQYHQSYGGYAQQPPPRGGYNSGTPHSGGYGYYGQGSHASENHPSNVMPNPAHTSTPGPVNYNYGQSQPPSYGQPTPYGQPSQHSYGPGYNELKYDNQAPGQHYYGQPPTQAGSYGQQAIAQSGYGQQQPYKTGYGAPQGVQPTYGPPRATHPGDPMYQGAAPSSYPTQQSYPYGSTTPQPVPAYTQQHPASGAMDGYAQPPAAYPPHGGQTVPSYSQGLPVSAYTQPSSQPGAYGQYPTTQQSYTDPSTGNVNYPYPTATADATYASAAPVSGAAPQATSQPGYAQPAATSSVYYDQSVPAQAAYAGQQ